MAREQNDAPPAWLSIFLVFLRLGSTSFGGPVAHLGYFRAEFVQKRRWFSDDAFLELVALCQFLPGPASSQVGFGVGLLRGGLRGGLAAWAGFTLPSALLMTLFAYEVGAVAASPTGMGVLHGLRLAAVAIVAGAVLGMVRATCVDRLHASIAAAGVVVSVVVPGFLGQGGAIALGALVGVLLAHPDVTPEHERREVDIGRTFPLACLVVVLALLAISFVPVRGFLFELWDAFYRSGALVFGGGHVVLPLLHDAVVSPGWVSENNFVTGYAAAQTLPGPLFAFAAYLGEVARPGGGLSGAIVALVAIFLPGILLLVGILPFWGAWRAKRMVRGAMSGANAIVVGILAAALYDPVWTSAVTRPVDFSLVVIAFILLVAWRMSPLLVVATCGIAGPFVA